MLQLKTFNFGQDKEMNELLSQYRLAAGAHVFVSDGKLIIPYEDGSEKTNVQRIIDVKEQKNIILDQMEIIKHSQEVLSFLKKDAHIRVNEAEANLAEAEGKKGKEKFDAVKACEETLKSAKRAFNDLEGQENQNKVELLRLQLNIDLFNKKIEELSK